MKKRILFIVDVPGWAYDDAAQNWKALLKDEYDVDILYLNKFESARSGHKMMHLIKKYQSAAVNNIKIDTSELLDVKNLYLYSQTKSGAIGPVFNHEKYDGIYFFYHRALCDIRLMGTPIPLNKVAIAVNNEKWVQAGAEKEFNTYMEGAKVIVGCNDFIINNFKKHHPKVMRASQAINPAVFRYNREEFVSKRTGRRMVVGWSGNWSNKLKNFEAVKKACTIAGVKLVKVKDLGRKELNDWYNQVDAVVCASHSEGGPLVILEAGAVGLPVITTPVGLSREIIEHNKNGLIVNQNPLSIANAINILSMKKNNRERIAKALREEVLRNWTYEARLHEIRKILKELCN